jgi:hypothetical protein
MDRKEVDGEHDDDGDQHLGHFATRPELVVQRPVRRIQPEMFTRRSLFRQRAPAIS